MAFTKIEDADLNGIGVIGLPDTPGLSTAAMQSKFEETARSVIIPKHNGLIDELGASASAGDLGATPVTGRVSAPNIQAVMEKLSTDLKTVEDGMAEAIADAHTHDNKELLDSYNQTNADITDAISKKHTHSNKALLDSYTQTEANLADAVSKKHTHANKTVLDDLSDNSGELQYKGSPIAGAVKDAYKEIDVMINGTATKIIASNEDTVTFKPGANVTLAANATTKEITISSTGGGGGGGGDMYEADYDNSGTVKTAGGIDAYVATEVGKLDVSDSAVAGKYVSAVSETDGKISVTRADLPTVPTDLDDLSDVTYSGSLTQGQALIVNSSGKFENQALPSGGHDMISNTGYVATMKTNSLNPSDDKVASTYAISNWSNCDAIVLTTTVAQGTDTVGDWEAEGTWDGSGGSRSGWLWSADLYQILEDGNGNPVLDVEVIPVFDNAKSEAVSLYAYRIDDDVQNGGVDGGAVAFKLNGKIQSANGLKLGLKLVRQRTKVSDFTPLT